MKKVKKKKLIEKNAAEAGAAVDELLVHMSRRPSILAMKERFIEVLEAFAESARKDERDRLNGEYEGPGPTRGELLNIIKGYDNELLAQIVAKHGDKLRPNWKLGVK